MILNYFQANQDNDFDYKENSKGKAANIDEKTQAIQNNHFDEALDLSGNGSGMQKHKIQRI